MRQDLIHWLTTLAPLAKYPPASWRITRLGGLGNRNYRLRNGHADLMLRLPGAGTEGLVDRAAEIHNVELAAQLGLCPPLLHGDDHGVQLFRYLGDARPLTGRDCREPAMLERIGTLLARLHGSGMVFRGRVDLDGTLERYWRLASPLPPEVEALLAATAPLRRHLADTRKALAPCHLDPHPGNFLITAGGRLYLVDWEYSAMGEPLWDLATLAGEAALDGENTAMLLDAHGRLPDRASLRRLTLYRGLLALLALLWWYVHHPGQRQAAYPRERWRRARCLLGWEVADRQP